MRQYLAACLLGLQSWVAAGAAPVGPAPDLSMLAATAGDADPATVTSGALDGQFGPFVRLTCSIGVATSDTLGVWGEHLVARADAAVYAAKNSGRNQVHVALPAAA